MQTEALVLMRYSTYFMESKYLKCAGLLVLYLRFRNKTEIRLVVSERRYFHNKLPPAQHRSDIGDPNINFNIIIKFLLVLSIVSP